MRKSSYKDKNRKREIVRKQKKRYYGKTKNVSNKGQRWTIREIELVMEHSISDMELSSLIGRSVGSIQTMRCMQKKAITKKDEKKS